MKELSKEFCYKSGEKLDMEVKPIIKLAIGTIAMEHHITEAWKNHIEKLYDELDELKKEIHFEYDHLFIYNKPRPEAREILVKQVLKAKATHLFFIDADTFIPEGALKSLLKTIKKTDYKVLCLPVYLKKMPLISNIFQDSMFAPLSKLPRKIFKIDLTGLAACLIDTKVFKEIEAPFFQGKFDNVVEREGSQDIHFHLKTGEDIAFFFKLKKANIDVYCEPNFICEYYDQERDIFYPSLIKSKEKCYEEEEVKND